MILQFLIGDNDSILIAAAQIPAIRTVEHLLVVYLAGAEPIHVPINDYNCSAIQLWQQYVEGQK